MRADKRIYFVEEGTEYYDPNTGNYIKGEDIKNPVMALVTDTGTERMNLLYGGIKQNAKTIRLNYKYVDEFDYVKIDEKKYQVDMVRNYRHKMTLEVSAI